MNGAANLANGAVEESERVTTCDTRDDAHEGKSCGCTIYNFRSHNH